MSGDVQLGAARAAASGMAARSLFRPRAGLTDAGTAALAGIRAVARPGGRIARAQRPNQRARLVAPKACFSAAYSRDGSFRCAAAAGPPRKLTATLLTSPSPNSA